MIDHLEIVDGVLAVHMREISGKTIRAFATGRFAFDSGMRSAVFGSLAAVDLPRDLRLEEGAEIRMRLIDPDGIPLRQTRCVLLTSSPARPGLYIAPGRSRSPRRFPAEAGWIIETFKYRAYISHPGLNTDSGIPAWLNKSVSGQIALWNRLAWLCREARRKCSAASTEQLRNFMQTSVLPAIDSHNRSAGSARHMLRHPQKLKREDAGIGDLWRFAAQLRSRMQKGLAVPEGLLDDCVTFAKRFLPDYLPIREFLGSLRSIARREAAELGLKWYESEPVILAFTAATRKRRTVKASFSEGWPAIKYREGPESGDWRFMYRMKSAEIKAEDLEGGSGIPGLSFGPPLPPEATGHPNQVGSARLRRLREARISIHREKGQKLQFRFGVLQHRPLPDGSHIKAWSLSYKQGSLWLHLTVERHRTLPRSCGAAAGLDISWRRTDSGISFGTLYEPVSHQFQRLLMDFRRSPGDQSARVPFRIDFGPTRWERRNIVRLLPEWKPGDAVPGTFELRRALQSWMASQCEAVIMRLRGHLGERFPAWAEGGGRHTLRKLANQFNDDPVLLKIVAEWQHRDEQERALYSLLHRKTTRRTEDGHAEVAHDVCRFLKAKGINQLVIEENFLARASQEWRDGGRESLARSQKYRQFAAPGKFVRRLREVAAKYEIAVHEIDPAYTTRICRFCSHLNPSTALEEYACGRCGRLIRQGENGAVNLSRFFGDPELAAAAQFAGEPWKRGTSLVSTA